MESIIKWRKNGKPNEGDVCLILLESGVVSQDYWMDDCWMVADGERVVGWCRITEVRTHKQIEK